MSSFIGLGILPLTRIDSWNFPDFFGSYIMVIIISPPLLTISFSY